MPSYSEICRDEFNICPQLAFNKHKMAMPITNLA